ncbi:ankyrin repeat domain-containing protein [bacterium]|nr:ankyrin repeat domain-containing protein [bacterium]
MRRMIIAFLGLFFKTYKMAEAIESAHVERVNKLLTQGVRSNARVFGDPLVVWAAAGDLAVLKTLVLHGANVNTPGNGGMTALIKAVQAGLVKNAHFLLVAGASRAAHAAGKSVTDHARSCGKDQAEMVRLISTFDPVERQGLTFFDDTESEEEQIATRVQMLEIQSSTYQKFKKYILGAIRESRMRYGTIEAYKKGQEDFSSWGNGVVLGSEDWVLKKVYENLLSLNPIHVITEKPAELEWQENTLAEISIMIHARLEYNTVSMYLGMLRSDVYCAFGYGFEMIDVEPRCVKYWEEVKTGKDPLKDSVLTGDLEGVKEAVLRGADLKRKDSQGFTPLLLASLNGYARIVDFLLEKGADIGDVNRSGLNALMLAVHNDHLETAEVLIRRGIDVNYETPVFGSTVHKLNAIKIAQEGRKLALIKLLMRSGARELKE